MTSRAAGRAAGPWGDPEVPSPRLSWPWFLLLAAVATAALLLHSPLLAVSRIEVIGTVRSDTAARVAATGVGEGALLLWVDTGAVRRAVAEDPWVREVAVERVWPNRLVVEVVERTPILWIQGTTGWMLVSSDGVVVDHGAAPTLDHLQAALAVPDLPVGGRPEDAIWRELVEMALVLQDGIGPGLRVEMRGRQLWARVGDIEIRFGHPIDLADKARAVEVLLEEGLPVGSVVDVTSPQRPAVRLPDPPGEIEG